jgi:hypothetical protein
MAVAPSESEIGAMSSADDAIQRLIVPYTVGCNTCLRNSIPIISYDLAFGLYYQKCEPSWKFDFTKENVPCAKIG